MRRKNEENLIKLAFGDMTPDETSRAKQLLIEDAEAQQLFAGYSEIREGLKQLKAPEHQLSTERLREAILRDGLKKEKPAASGWASRRSWTLAPAAVAAAAFFITMRIENQHKVNGPVVPSFSNTANDFTPSYLKAPSAGSSEPIGLPTRSSAGDIAEKAIQGSTSVDRSEPAPTIASAKPVDTGAIREAFRSKSDVSKKELKSKVSPEDFSHLAFEGALPAGAVALSSFDSGEEMPIVLIGSENDDVTGANRATEVSSANNVVVGG